MLTNPLYNGKMLNALSLESKMRQIWRLIGLCGLCHSQHLKQNSCGRHSPLVRRVRPSPTLLVEVKATQLRWTSLAVSLGTKQTFHVILPSHSQAFMPTQKLCTAHSTVLGGCFVNSAQSRIIFEKGPRLRKCLGIRLAFAQA